MTLYQQITGDVVYQAKLVQKAQAAGRGLYGDTAGLQSLTAAQLKRVHISGQQGVHVPTLEEFLRYHCHGLC